MPINTVSEQEQEVKTVSLTLEKKDALKKEFSVGDYVSYALKGIYRIEHIEVLSLTGVPDRYYVLSHAFNKTIHKTFVPIKTASSMGMRSLTSRSVFKRLEETIQALELKPEEVKNNSNKKMKSYENRIKKYGLFEIVHSYFCVHHDLKMTKRGDRRYIQFSERLKELICEEMSLVTCESLDFCREQFATISRKYQSQ